QFCRQHTTAQNTAEVYDAAHLNTMVATSSRSPADAGGGVVADVRGIKRKHDECPGSGSCAVVGTHRCVYPSPRPGGTMLPLLPAQISTGADGGVSPDAKA
ncbi:unnamed protein product, partial [Sphacelaria rigidula]